MLSASSFQHRAVNGLQHPVTKDILLIVTSPPLRHLAEKDKNACYDISSVGCHIT